jgi:hypothetical protein
MAELIDFHGRTSTEWKPMRQHLGAACIRELLHIAGLAVVKAQVGRHWARFQRPILALPIGGRICKVAGCDARSYSSHAAFSAPAELA